MVAQTIINPTQKVGRNDDCPCKSGKKWKYCCGSGEGTIPKPKKILSPQGFNQCFMILLDRVGGSVDISCEEMEKLIKNKDAAMALKYNTNTDSFHFEMVKVKVSKILQPGGKRMEVVEEKKENKVKENQNEENTNDNPTVPIGD